MRILLLVYLLLALALASTAQARKPAPGGNAARGKAVFKKHCAECHYTSDQRKIGPGMKGLYRKPNLEESGEPVNDSTVRELIEKGAAAGEMPPFAGKIKPREMADLLAYLRKL